MNKRYNLRKIGIILVLMSSDFFIFAGVDADVFFPYNDGI